MFILSINNGHNILISIHYFLPSIIYLGIVVIYTRYLPTAVAVIGAGEVFSMTATFLGAALLSHRLTLAVDHVTVVELDLSRHRGPKSAHVALLSSTVPSHRSICTLDVISSRYTQ